VKLPEMKTGLTISALAHAALLLWGLISFSARPLEAAPKDALPVDIISDKEFSELTKGVKNAPKEAPPKPLVEKIADPKPVEDSTAKVSEKKEIKEAKAAAEPPPPPPPLPEPKRTEAKSESKEPPKVDPIAETLKKEEAKKKAEEKKKAEKRKSVPPQPKFDPNKIAALLDKREARREAATGEALVPVPGLGTPRGSAPRLSQSEIDALRARLMELWNVPAGVQNPDELKIRVLIRIGRDRKLGGPPRVLTSGSGPLYVAARDSAVRALFLSQPFDMLRPEHYELWKEIEVTFDPRYMFRG